MADKETIAAAAHMLAFPVLGPQKEAAPLIAQPSLHHKTFAIRNTFAAAAAAAGFYFAHNYGEALTQISLAGRQNEYTKIICAANQDTAEYNVFMTF